MAINLNYGMRIGSTSSKQQTEPNKYSRVITNHDRKLELIRDHLK